MKKIVSVLFSIATVWCLSLSCFAAEADSGITVAGKSIPALWVYVALGLLGFLALIALISYIVLMANAARAQRVLRDGYRLADKGGEKAVKKAKKSKKDDEYVFVQASPEELVAAEIAEQERIAAIVAAEEAKKEEAVAANQPAPATCVCPMMQNAVANSPKIMYLPEVIVAPTEKKTKFVKNEGLTQKERKRNAWISLGLGLATASVAIAATIQNQDNKED